MIRKMTAAAFAAIALGLPAMAQQTASDPMMVTTIAGTTRMGSTGAPAPAGVTKTDVRENGLYGEFYAPEGKTGLPVLLILGGSEGGLLYSSRYASSFTRQGYAVLALAYFAEVGLPRTLENVPLEYFDKAVGWLKARAEVNAAKIGVMGVSRGSEAALLLASRNSDVKAVLAIAPGSVSGPGIDPANMMKPSAAWTAGGKALPFPRYQMASSFEESFRNALKATPEAEIAVETISGPVLLISGEDDRLWPSTPMAKDVVARLKAKRFKHDAQHLSYPGAGHMVFAGDVTGMPAPPPGAPARPGPGGMSVGGTPEANYKAWTDNWPKAVKFLDDALKRE